MIAKRTVDEAGIITKKMHFSFHQRIYSRNQIKIHIHFYQLDYQVNFFFINHQLFNSLFIFFICFIVLIRNIYPFLLHYFIT